MRSSSTRHVFAAGATALVLGSGCDGTTKPADAPDLPAAVTAIEGDAQFALVATAVATAPSVKVTNKRGAPSPGVTVTFAVTSGGGSLTGPVGRTDASGIATVGGWILGPTPGANTLTATVAGLAGASVTFNASAVAAIVTVTTASDEVSGNVASPLELMARPGSDGISLREALLAVNAVPRAFDITFSSSLVGQRIALKSVLPAVVRDGTRLLGVLAPGGTPGLTLDAAGITQCCAFAVINIKASHVTVSGLRFVNVGLPGRNAAIDVAAEPGPNTEASPATITDVRIESNHFDNRPIELPAYGVHVGHSQDPRPPFGTRVERVTITGNSFNHYQGDATTVHLEEGGTSGTLTDVTVSENTFMDCTYAVELVIPKGSGNRIANTLIRRNSFTGRGQPISIGTSPAPSNGGNVIDHTVITGNGFAGSEHGALHVTSGYRGAVGSAVGSTVSNTWFSNNTVTNSHWGVMLWGGEGAASGNRIDATVIAGNRFTTVRRAVEVIGGIDADDNTVSNTTLLNNIIERGTVGVYIGGGVRGTGNHVDGVRVINNTIHLATLSGVMMHIDSESTGNRVTGFDVRNSIFWSPGAAEDWDFEGDVDPSGVSFTLTRQPGYDGHNGNRNADPAFVAPSAGDYHLTLGSPAIDRGTLTGAPAMDFACFPRSGAPDLGALEYGSGPSQCIEALPSLGFQLVRTVPSGRQVLFPQP